MIDAEQQLSAVEERRARMTIARLERGDEEARFTTIWKLAQALGVEPGDLTGAE